MSKTLSIIFGLGLIVLWVVAISQPGITSWLTWLDGIVGLCAVIMGLAMTSDSPKSLRMGGPVIIAIALFALWIIGMAISATGWLSWWTFGFACAFLFTGFTSTSTPMTPHRPLTA